jgi:O-antigen/teichoic acid export membrane protein
MSQGWSLTLLGWILIWGLSGASAGVLALGHFGRLSLKQIRFGWLRTHWDFSWKYLASTLVTQVAILIGVGLIALFSSPAAVAAVRAVTLLTRPGFAVKNAVGQSVATDIARDDPRGRDLWQQIRRAIVITTSVAAVNTLALLALDDRIGTTLLGETWPLAAALVLPAGLQLAMETLSTGTRESILGHREVDIVLLIDSLGAVLWVVAAGVGAALGDAQGVLWGGVLAEATRAVVWWAAFLRRLPRWNAAEPAAVVPSRSAVSSAMT